MPSLPSRFPVELGSVQDPETQVGRLHRLAMAGGLGWALARFLRTVKQVDGENSAGQTGLFLSALLGHTSTVQHLLIYGANPNHRSRDGSTPVHAGAFSGRSLVMLQLLRAGGDLRLHDQQGRTPQDWAEQGGSRHSREVLELLQLCRAHISSLIHSGELAPTMNLGQLQGHSRHSLCGPRSPMRLAQADRALRQEQIRRTPRMPTLGFGRLSSLWPLGLVIGIPLADPKELLPAQGEPDRTYQSSSHTLMTNLLWQGHPVTVRQLKAPGAQPDVLVADLQHCSSLHHPNLLLLMALSPSADLSGLRLVFEPVWLGSLHTVLHPQAPSEREPCPVPGLSPSHLLLQVLEALLFLQARWQAHGGLSSHAVQLVRPGLAKVGSLEHGRPLHQSWLRSRPQQGSLWEGPGLPPPPELYPWLPLEFICGDTPATTSDLYSFCILAQEVFTGELPWAGRSGPEVKAKLEAGESPTLDPLVPASYQALVRAGLGLKPADRWGSLQSTRYLLREAVAQVQDSVLGVAPLLEHTTLCLGAQGSPAETSCCKVAPEVKAAPRTVSPVLQVGAWVKHMEDRGHWKPPGHPCQRRHHSLETPATKGSSGQRGMALASDSSLTLVSSPSPSPCLCPGHSPPARTHLPHCLEPLLTAPSTEPINEGLFSSLQTMDLLEEILAELQGGAQHRDRPSLDLAPDTDSWGAQGPLSADSVPQASQDQLPTQHLKKN